MKIARKINKPAIVGMALAFVIILIEVGVLISERQLSPTGHLASEKQLAVYAKQVIEKCKNTPYHPSCYDNEIPKLMDFLSMEDAFQVTRVIQQSDTQYMYCHVLGHKLSMREVKKDPSKWKDVMTRCPTTMCNNGCLHGPLLTRFNSETLSDKQIETVKPDFRDACEPRGAWNPVGVEISMCYHGLGHLNMYATGADIKKSLKLCEYESIKNDGRNYIQTCTQGVFMQVFQPLEPEDYALTKSLTQTKQTVVAFCNQFSGEAYGACKRESWPLYRDELLVPQGAQEFCSYSKDPIENRKCYSNVMSMVTVVMVINKNSITSLASYCNGLPIIQKDTCFGDAAIRLVQVDPRYQDKAIEVCNSASNQGVCYETLALFGKQSFKLGSKEMASFCSLFPAIWKNECLTGQKK